MAQCCAEAGRTTEPEARLGPAGNCGTDPLTGQKSIAGVDAHVQLDACRDGVRRKLGERGVVGGGGRMEQMDLRRRGAVASRKVLHPCDKGRDADATADPDLYRTVVLECEVSIWPLDHDILTDPQRLAQPRGVVAELLNDEDDAAVIVVPGRGNGVGMRAFRRVRGDKCKLPGFMARPAVGTVDGHLERMNARVVLQGCDPGRRFSTGSDTAEKNDHRAIGSGQQEERQQQSERREPVAELRQHDRVGNEREVGNGQQTMRLVEQAIGNSLHERHDDQQNRRIEGPLADDLRDSSIARKKLLDRV